MIMSEMMKMIDKDPIFFWFIGLPFLICLSLLMWGFVIGVFCLIRQLWRDYK